MKLRDDMAPTLTSLERRLHFAALAERYHVVNRAIHRAESEVEPVSDEHAEELKRQRLALLDEIAAIIAAERTA